jgi:hypothetical protein
VAAVVVVVLEEVVAVPVVVGRVGRVGRADRVGWAGRAGRVGRADLEGDIDLTKEMSAKHTRNRRIGERNKNGTQTSTKKRTGIAHRFLPFQI